MITKMRKGRKRKKKKEKKETKKVTEEQDDVYLGCECGCERGYCFSNTKKKRWKKKVGKKNKLNKKNTKCGNGDDTVMQVN